MAEQDKAGIKIRGDVPKVVQLNRRLIMMVLLLVGLGLGAMVVHALQRPQHHAKDTDRIAIKQASDKTINDVFSAVPSDYQHLKNRPGQSTGIADKAEIQRSLDSLSHKQDQLLYRMNQLERSGGAKQPTRNSAEDNRSARSAMFFTGGGPKREIFRNNRAVTKSGSVTKSSHTKLSAYQAQSMQGNKINFLKHSEEKDAYNKGSLQTPVSPYEIQAGTIIPANLLTGINSDLPGQIVAQVRENIYDSQSGRYLLIPQGSRLIGKYDSQVAYAQQRILFSFTRLIRPDGSSIIFDPSSATDSQGQAGLADGVDNHWGRVIGSAALSTALSLGTVVRAGNVNGYYPSPQQQIAQNAASNIASIGQHITNKSLNIQPTITVRPGYPLNIVVSKDMVLSPYGS